MDGAGGGGGGAGHGRGREEQLKKAFQRVNLPVSTNQGNSQFAGWIKGSLFPDLHLVFYRSVTKLASSRMLCGDLRTRLLSFMYGGILTACRILEEAQEQRGGEEENAVSTLSWGEFCVFCAEMHPLAANPSQRAAR